MMHFSPTEFLSCVHHDFPHSFELNAEPSEEIMQCWRQDGYLHLRGILSSRLIADIGLLMRESLASLQHDFLHSTGKKLEDPGTMNQLMDGSAESDAWYESISRDLQHLVRGEYPLHIRTHPKLMLPASEERLTNLLRALLGTQHLRMHYPPMLRFKMPGVEQSRVPLHQDAPYFSHLGDFINVWFPLCPVNGECGGVEVLEGSHVLGPLDHESAVLWGHYLEPTNLEARFRVRRIEMETGDALLFGPHLIHRSVANTSNRIRYSVDCRWFSGESPALRQYYDVALRQVVRAF